MRVFKWLSFASCRKKKRKEQEAEGDVCAHFKHNAESSKKKKKQNGDWSKKKDSAHIMRADGHF